MSEEEEEEKGKERGKVGRSQKVWRIGRGSTDPEDGEGEEQVVV